MRCSLLSAVKWKRRRLVFRQEPMLSANLCCNFAYVSIHICVKPVHIFAAQINFKSVTWNQMQGQGPSAYVSYLAGRVLSDSSSHISYLGGSVWTFVNLMSVCYWLGNVVKDFSQQPEQAHLTLDLRSDNISLWTLKWLFTWCSKWLFMRNS